jgi:hypothetical protein
VSTVELIYKIGANSSSFSRELGNAERNVQRFQRRAESNILKVGKAFASMGGLAAGALAGIVKQTIDMGSELSVLSDKVGLSVESLSALGWAAEQAGVEESKFRSGLARLNVTLNDTNRGVGEAANVAEKYGIALKTATGEMLPQEQVLSNLADAVANAKNSYEEAEIAAAFFGTRAGEFPVICIHHYLFDDFVVNTFLSEIISQYRFASGLPGHPAFYPGPGKCQIVNIVLAAKSINRPKNGF